MELQCRSPMSIGASTARSSSVPAQTHRTLRASSATCTTSAKRDPGCPRLPRDRHWNPEDSPDRCRAAPAECPSVSECRHGDPVPRRGPMPPDILSLSGDSPATHLTPGPLGTWKSRHAACRTATGRPCSSRSRVYQLQAKPAELRLMPSLTAISLTSYQRTPSSISASPVKSESGHGLAGRSMV